MKKYHPQPAKFLTRERIDRADGGPYQERFTLFRCRWFGVLLHRFVGADDECQHDHPFPFISVILSGGYFEHTPSGVKLYLAGAILFRPATWQHRIVPLLPGKTITLVLHGPRVRAWGFTTPKFGWVPWQAYSGRRHCA